MRAAIELPAGRILYCGSAKGQGGSKARLSRHFKSVRWHIDQLTERGSVVSAFGISPTLMNVSWYGDLRSCQFRSRGSAAAIAKCRSYLLEWSNGAALPQVTGQEPMPPGSGLMRHESSFLED
jgi:histidyl-tRNA synthetase